MSRTFAAAALAPVLALGCATTVDTQLPPDHPANPAAAEAPLPQYSRTLQVGTTQPASAAAPQSPAAPERGGHHAHH